MSRTTEHNAKERGLGKWGQATVPKTGWVCTFVHDLGEPSAICEMCEVMVIRYVHHMKHPEYPVTLLCGCICAGYMEEDVVAAIKRHRSMTQESAKISRKAKQAAFDAQEQQALIARILQNPDSTTAMRLWALTGYSWTLSHNKNPILYHPIGLFTLFKNGRAWNCSVRREANPAIFYGPFKQIDDAAIFVLNMTKPVSLKEDFNVKKDKQTPS